MKAESIVMKLNDFVKEGAYDKVSSLLTKVSRCYAKGPDNLSIETSISPVLYTAVKHHHLKCIKLLLDFGCDPNYRIEACNTTILLEATKMISKTSMDFVDVMLDFGADPNVPDSNGFTPLHLSVINNNVPMLLKLLSKGANVHAMDNLGQTPLHWAVKLFCINSLSALLIGGANVHSTDKFGNTPLLRAIYECISCGRREVPTYGVQFSEPKSRKAQAIVIKLLENGSNIFHLNQESKSAHSLIINDCYCSHLLYSCSQWLFCPWEWRRRYLCMIEGHGDLANYSHVMKYLFNDMITREICTFMCHSSEESANIGHIEAMKHHLLQLGRLRNGVTQNMV